MYYLISPLAQNHIHGTKVDVARANFNLDDIRPMLVPFPSIEEQIEIVRRAEKRFKLADSLEAKYDKAMERVEKIEQSVLAKAFRGELAPQNPNDEPAEELLKRILAEKAIPSIAHKGRRRAKLQTPRKKPQRSLRPPR
jgi:type I restriction enzyme S subunit